MYRLSLCHLCIRIALTTRFAGADTTGLETPFSWVFAGLVLDTAQQRLEEHGYTTLGLIPLLFLVRATVLDIYKVSRRR